MSGAVQVEETPEERLERYRRMADSTRELAGRSDDAEIRNAYLELAAKWVRLAEQAARDVSGPVPLAPTSAGQPRLPDDRAHA